MMHAISLALANYAEARGRVDAAEAMRRVEAGEHLADVIAEQQATLARDMAPMLAFAKRATREWVAALRGEQP